jgi:hypothetical protein
VGTCPCKAERFQILGLRAVGVTLFVVKYLRGLLGFFKVSTRRPAEVPGRGRDLHYATCFLSFDLRAGSAMPDPNLDPLRLRRFRDLARQRYRQHAISSTSCIDFYIAGDLELVSERLGDDACCTGIVLLRCPFSRR